MNKDTEKYDVYDRDWELNPNQIQRYYRDNNLASELLKPQMSFISFNNLSLIN